VINSDPANDSLPDECAVNIEDLIEIVAEHGLGTNEDLVYYMDFLEKNIDWLQFKPEPLVKDHYFLFDFPGRLKLFTLHLNAKKIEEVYRDAVQELRGQGDHSRGTNMRHSGRRLLTLPDHGVQGPAVAPYIAGAQMVPFPHTGGLFQKTVKPHVFSTGNGTIRDDASITSDL
jgi:hypothetical protein